MSISFISIAASLAALMSCSGNGDDPAPFPSDTRSMTVPQSVEIAHDAGSFSIDVQANFTFSAEPQVDWIGFDNL